ncbi:MAG TPA: radical SAM protein [Nevskiaceae bacterium]|nr:radical SAM protein [Nevskiaceae bacterium]
MKNKLRKGLGLLKGIFNYNILRHFKPLAPTGLQINVTYRCNSKCQMCHIWKVKPKNELSFREWQRIMRDQIFSSTERLTITGGEPTLHPELVKLARLFISSMPQLQFLVLVTNGFLTDRTISLVKTLAKLSQGRGINFTVSVSLDGIGKMHDEIRGVPKAFEKTSSTILGLKELQAKYHFWLNVAGVAHRKNLYHIKDIQQWCQRRGIDFNLQLVGFHKSYVQNIEKKQELDFRENDKEYLHSILKKLSRPSFRRDLRYWLKCYYWNDMLALYRGGRRTTPCPFVLDAFVLDSLGDVYYCLSERKIGNCRQGKSVSEIYYHPKNLKFRRRLAKSACLKCNSACFVTSAIAKDFKKFIWYYFTRRRGPVGVY